MTTGGYVATTHTHHCPTSHHTAPSAFPLVPHHCPHATSPPCTAPRWFCLPPPAPTTLPLSPCPSPITLLLRCVLCFACAPQHARFHFFPTARFGARAYRAPQNISARRCAHLPTLRNVTLRLPTITHQHFIPITHYLHSISFAYHGYCVYPTWFFLVLPGSHIAVAVLPVTRLYLTIPRATRFAQHGLVRVRTRL